MLMIKQQNNRETSQIQLAMTCHIMHRKYLTHSYKPVCTSASILIQFVSFVCKNLQLQYMTWQTEVPHSFSIYEFSIHAPPPYNLSQIFDKNNKDQMSRRFHMKPHRSLVSELTCKFKRYMAQLCLNKMHRKQSTYNLPIK